MMIIKSPQETKLIIFGNPKAGTDLMLADHDFSIDLPLKIVLKKNKEDTADLERWMVIKQ